MKTKFQHFINENNNDDFQVIFDEKDNKRGKILTPYVRTSPFYKDQPIEISFHELYKGCFSFAKYNVIQFIIKVDNVEEAIEMAKERIEEIFEPGQVDANEDVFVVTGFRYDEQNDKTPYTPAFMENTHHRNQFTADSYKTKKGDLLKYDVDGDGFGFWYAVDEKGKRISSRLKGSIFQGLYSDGVIAKWWME